MLLRDDAGLRASVPYALLRARVENFTELLPACAGPSLELQLRPDHVVAVAGVDADAGQHGRQRDVLQRFRLLDDVVARKIVAALLEDLLQYQALLLPRQLPG